MLVIVVTVGFRGNVVYSAERTAVAFAIVRKGQIRTAVSPILVSIGLLGNLSVSILVMFVYKTYDRADKADFYIT